MLALAKGLTLTEGITLSVAGAAAGMTLGWRRATRVGGAATA